MSKDRLQHYTERMYNVYSSNLLSTIENGVSNYVKSFFNSNFKMRYGEEIIVNYINNEMIVENINKWIN